MNVFFRFLKRLRFKKTIKSDQSKNVVDGMVKARKLYKELCLKAHPDKHINKKEIAEELMKRLVENRFNYEELKAIQSEIREKLAD